MDSSDLLKEKQKIKEYLSKLEALKKGILEERQKSQSYQTKIKDKEFMIKDKDTEIYNLQKANLQLENQLDFELSKKKSKSTNKNSILDHIFHKEKFSKEKLSKLKEDNKNLRLSITNLNNQILIQDEMSDQYRVKSESMLTYKKNTLTETIKKQETIAKELVELRKWGDNMKKINIENERQKKIYEDELEKHRKELTESEDNLKKSNEFLEETKKKHNEADVYISKLKSQLDTIAVDLAKLKTQSENKTVSRKEFKVLKKGDIRKKMETIAFDKNKNNVIEMIIYTPTEERHVPFSKINNFKIDDTEANGLYVEYKLPPKDEIKKGLFIAHEKVRTYMIEQYIEFNKEAMKTEMI